MIKDKRNAHFEFTNRKRVTITTAYRQKIFELKDEACCADLMDLSLVKGEDISWIDPPSPFFAYFSYDDNDDSYIGEVIAKTKEDNLEKIGEVHWKDSNKVNYNVTLAY
jgi:hypothetical protein